MVTWCCSAAAPRASGRALRHAGRRHRAAPTTRRPGGRCRRSPMRARAETPDEIWLTEHPPIYTLGLAGRREHLLRDNGIPVLKVDRGGQVTYHGPGQLVAYTLLDLAPRAARHPRHGPGARGRGDSMARFAWASQPTASRRPRASTSRQATAEAKIAALGLRVQSRLHLSRPGGQHRHGSRPFCRHRPLRLRGSRGDAARATSASCGPSRRRAPSLRLFLAATP